MSSYLSRTSGKIETFRRANARHVGSLLFGGTTGVIPLSEQKPGSPQPVPLLTKPSDQETEEAHEVASTYSGQ